MDAVPSPIPQNDSENSISFEKKVSDSDGSSNGEQSVSDSTLQENPASPRTLKTLEKKRNCKKTRDRDISDTVQKLRKQLKIDTKYQLQVLEETLLQVQKLKKQHEFKVWERAQLCKELNILPPNPRPSPIDEDPGESSDSSTANQNFTLGQAKAMLAHLKKMYPNIKMN